MSGAIMNKVWDLFKMPAEDKDDEDAVDYDEVIDREEQEEEDSGEQRKFFGKRNSKENNTYKYREKYCHTGRSSSFGL